MALVDRTLIHIESECETLLNATLPRATDPSQLEALSHLLEGVGMWLGKVLDVVLHVSVTDPWWWGHLSEVNGLTLGGAFFEFSIVIEDDYASAGFGEEGQL